MALKTLQCLLFLMLYNVAIFTNSQYVASPLSNPPASSYAPSSMSIPYPTKPISPSVPISLSPSDLPMPVFSPSDSTYAPTPMSIPYPATPVSPSVPIAYSPSDTIVPATSPSDSSYAPTPRSIPYPATPVSPGVPISYSPPTSSYAPPPTSICYPITPVSPPSDSATPVSPPSNPSYAPAPKNVPYPGTPTSPSLPGVPASHSPSYPTSPPFFTPEPTPAPAPSRGPTPSVHNPPGVKAAYWPAFNGLDPSTINTTYLTHIYYAFLLIDGYTYKLIVTPSAETLIPQFINSVSQKNPPVKTLLSIGGFDFNQTNYFSNMSTTEIRRAIFINSTIEIARKYGFDGVDLDWEYPSNDQEMLNLAILFQEWRRSLEIESRITGKPRLLLTAAVYYASKFTNYGEPRSYPIPAINNYTDWINPMCYDYHGSWENFTGINAALFDPNSNLSTSYGVGSWLGSGMLPEKVVMGLPLYGRTWKLLDSNMDWIGAPAVGMGPGDGVLTYNEILEFNNGTNKGQVYFDGGMVSYYSVSGDSWVGYDDTMSVNRKVEYAQSLNLGGYFFWALGMDNNGILIRQASNSWDAK
ncbi:Class V chitinase CHIT5a [Euphorbia peplus]|nr:Class V chitinase CHIT5a [Euphorbia peplus]